MKIGRTYDMDFLERYLRTVKRYLTRSDRDDVVAELSANILARVDERESELGRPLGAQEYRIILEGYGNPIAVAQRFETASGSFSFGRQLVGPALFPYYLRILGLNALVACAIGVIAAVYAIPSWLGLPNILAHVVLQFAVVTVIFVAIQRYVDAHDFEWHEPTGERGISPLASISAIIVIVVANVWLLDVLRATTFSTPGTGSTVLLTPAWHWLSAPYVAFVCLELIRNGVNLVWPHALRFRAAMQVAASTVALIAVALLLRARPLLTARNLSDPSQVSSAQGLDGAAVASSIVAAIVILAMLAWQIRVLGGPAALAVRARGRIEPR